MKTLFKNRFGFLLLLSGLITNLAFIQATFTEEPQAKKKIKAVTLFNGKAAAANQAIGKTETDISLKIFPFDEEDRKANKELVVEEFEVALMRDGQKIATQTIFGSGSIAYLASIAKNEDYYQIQMKEIFERTPEGTLKPYTKGMMKLNYLFFDLKPFKDKIQVEMQEEKPSKTIK